MSESSEGLRLILISDVTEMKRQAVRHRQVATLQLIGRVGRGVATDFNNILCSNTDDHARNHAAFWNGQELSLTPAYDICPQGRGGNEASQAMLISGNNNLSMLKTCLETAHNFLLSTEDAHVIFDKQISIITENWDNVCEEAELNEVDKKMLWGRQFLNPFSVER